MYDVKSIRAEVCINEIDPTKWAVLSNEQILPPKPLRDKLFIQDGRNYFDHIPNKCDLKEDILPYFKVDRSLLTGDKFKSKYQVYSCFNREEYYLLKYEGGTKDLNNLTPIFNQIIEYTNLNLTDFHNVIGTNCITFPLFQMEELNKGLYIRVRGNKNPDSLTLLSSEDLTFQGSTLVSQEINSLTIQPPIIDYSDPLLECLGYNLNKYSWQGVVKDYHDSLNFMFNFFG